MAKIYNSDLTKELTDGAKIQQAFDKVPNEIAEKVVPVMEVNPKAFRRINLIKAGTKGTTGSSTVYTTPTDKDFFLTGLFIGYQADSAADNTYVRISGVINGETVYFIYSPKITLTAKSTDIVTNFQIPVKLDRNSIIAVSTAFTVGVCSMAYSINGYLVENINA